MTKVLMWVALAFIILKKNYLENRFQFEKKIFRLSCIVKRKLLDNCLEILSNHDARSLDISNADYNLCNEDELIISDSNNETQYWNENLVSAIFDSLNQNSILKLKKLLKSASAKNIKLSNIQDKDWIEVIKQQFKPINIKNKIWIVPSWVDKNNFDGLKIQIDPGMAFGTGEHPSTKLCLEWLISNVNKTDKILDFGCGSGILSIASKILNAKKVVGVDIDSVSIKTSLRNAQLNSVDIDFVKEIQFSKDTKFNIVIANIVCSTLLFSAPFLANNLKKGGKIALSGILSKQKREMIYVYKEWFKIENVYEKDSWCLISGLRK